ncbi:amidohydrolase family protein [Pararoseomonas indoligenes]|uniref:Amidohydrolase n=1 Tax=Roseomonas indoligenes TaxID=2820811 RepID=A0A940MVS5_9PROT|nr:amidohydrolase family protein [Pararoseomonas indoligenes]MBP0492608.1 amidohydrolase [Pararoseomonas indoligenes]
MQNLWCEPAGHSGFACACALPRRGLIRGALAAGAAALIPASLRAQAPTLPRRRRIDVHHHLTPPAYKDAVLRRMDFFPLQRDWTPQRTIADMDAAGIDVAILSVTTPGLAFAEGDERRRLARACNEYAAELMQRFPGRFGSFAALPLPDVEGSLAEAAYALDVLKADGVLLFTSYDGKWLGDPLFQPLYEELNRRRAIAATHPTSAPCCTNLQMPLFPDPLIEYGTDTTRTIGSLLFSGTAKRFPEIRFIFSHAGGTAPFLIERFEFQARIPASGAQLAGGVRPALGRFLYDTAQAANPVAMGGLLQVVPASQVVLGTDFPYRTCTEQVQGLAGLGLEDATLRRIESGNAEALLPRLKA